MTNQEMLVLQILVVVVLVVRIRQTMVLMAVLA
jgi:hypothetical protein